MSSMKQGAPRRTLIQRWRNWRIRRLTAKGEGFRIGTFKQAQIAASCRARAELLRRLNG